jgi:GntR family transcriptional regulator, transcriptional repressor for pyruvate dehydrogenase complex
MTVSSLALGAYAAVFAPLEAQGRADAVARRLADAITLGLLPDGSPLPSESDLAERFGVATVTVRDALGTLRDENLIHTRRGRGGGSFVRTPDDGGRQALMLRLRRTGLGELRDLADHYTAISAMAAQLAAERADESDVRRLRALARICHESPTSTGRRQGEGNFHLELAASAQSARLTREEMALQSEVGLLLWLSHTEASATLEAATRHTELVDHLARGDAAAARKVAETHVREMFSAVRELHRLARMEVNG